MSQILVRSLTVRGFSQDEFTRCHGRLLRGRTPGRLRRVAGRTGVRNPRRVTTDHDIARWRLRSQHLVTPHAESARAVIARLLAVQAETPSQAAWAVAGRTQHPDAADLDALLDEGEVVRTHVLRPTWHFVRSDDIGWLLDLTAPRIRPVFARQLTDGGLTSADLDRATTVVVGALHRQPDRTREQLTRCVRNQGLTLDGHAMTLLLGMLEVDRLICSGRRTDATHTYAVFADRVRSPRRLDRDEALAELALRYFTGHGPATERDLAYWATLTVTDVRRGLEQVAGRLASFDHDGRTFWHAAGQAPPSPGTEPRGHLLQILDELYRGYQDSRMVLDTAGVVPRGRETAIGMAVVDGQLVAGMKRTVARKVMFELLPYSGLEAEHWPLLEEAAARYGRFLGLEHELRVR